MRRGLCACKGNIFVRGGVFGADMLVAMCVASALEAHRGYSAKALSFCDVLSLHLEDLVCTCGCTPRPTPYTLHLTSYSIHLTPYALHHTPYTMHLAPYTLHPTPCTLTLNYNPERGRNWRWEVGGTDCRCVLCLCACVLESVWLWLCVRECGGPGVYV